VIDHHLFGFHHVNETVSPHYRVYWDVGFLIWGMGMGLSGGLLMYCGYRDARMEQRNAAARGPSFPLGKPAIWCGFGFGTLLIFATRPVWAPILFGYEPTIDELLSVRCFGA
jgi:hypothetical protein